MANCEKCGNPQERFGCVHVTQSLHGLQEWWECHRSRIIDQRTIDGMADSIKAIERKAD